MSPKAADLIKKSNGVPSSKEKTPPKKIGTFMGLPGLGERYQHWQKQLGANQYTDYTDITALNRAILDWLTMQKPESVAAHAHAITTAVRHLMEAEERRQRIELRARTVEDRARALLGVLMDPLILAMERLITKWVPPEHWDQAIEDLRKAGSTFKINPQLLPAAKAKPGPKPKAIPIDVTPVEDA